MYIVATPKPVLVDELLLAEAGHRFVGLHPGMHRVVVGGDVLKPLLTHALCDQFLHLLDRLDELALGEAEFLRAEARRRLRAGDSGEKEHCGRNCAEESSHRSSGPSVASLIRTETLCTLKIGSSEAIEA